MGSKYGQSPNFGSQPNLICQGIGALQGCNSGFGGGFFGRRLEGGDDEANNSTDDGEGATARHRRRLFEVPYSQDSGSCQDTASQCNQWQWKPNSYYVSSCGNYAWSEFENFGMLRPCPLPPPQPSRYPHPAASPDCAASPRVSASPAHPLPSALATQRATCTPDSSSPAITW